MHIYEPAEYLDHLATIARHPVHSLTLTRFERAYFKKRITPNLKTYTMTADQQDDLIDQIVAAPLITEAEYEAELDALIASNDEGTSILLKCMKDAHLNEIKRAELQQSIDVHEALVTHYKQEIYKVKQEIKAFVATGEIPRSFTSRKITTPAQYGNFLVQKHRHLMLSKPLGAANFSQLIREHHGLQPHSPQLSHLHAAQATTQNDCSVPFLYPYKPEQD